MVEFFKFLSFIKRKSNEKFKSVLSILLAIFLSSLLASVLSDVFVQWNYLGNTLRCLVALVGAMSLFLLVFIALSKRKKTKESALISYLKTLSYKQRLNLSLLLYGISIPLFLLLSSRHTSGYTVTAIFLFFIWITLFYYVKPTFDEVERAYYNLEDERDVDRSKAYFSAHRKLTTIANKESTKK